MDYTSDPAPGSVPGILHFIPPNLCAFEPTKPIVRSAHVNTLLWIGGMYDTLLSVSYPLALAAALGPTWSVMTCSLSTAGLSWGVGSVAGDANDIHKIAKFVRGRRPGGKIVLMGHSTGCQDCMEYVVGGGSGSDAGEEPARERVDGVVLQAPVSDRDALAHRMEAGARREADATAQAWSGEGRGEDVLPARLTRGPYGSAPIAARRWLDVSSPPPEHAGADDYFSADLPLERLRRTFGRFPASTALLILEGGDDESVPPHVDKTKLVGSWADVVRSSGGVVDLVNSGIVPGASHNLNNQSEEIVHDLVRRVVGFIDRLDNGELNKSAQT